MPGKIRMLIVAFTLLILTLATGCDQGRPAVTAPPGEQQAQTQQQTGGAAVETVSITVYYATKDAMNLVPEVHVVPKSDKLLNKAVELLLGQPKNDQLVKVLPDGVKLRGINVKDQVAYVDFNDKLIKNNRGGSANEILAVAAIVNTLTEFDEVRKVQILVEGKAVETLTGHVDVSEPLSRSERIIKKAL